MAYSKELAQRVRKLLAHIPDVQEKKMFGSIGFMVNNKLCIGVGEYQDCVMMVRVGPENFEEALKKKGAQSTIMRDRVMKGYVSLTDEAAKNQKALEEWVIAALDFNKKIKSS